MKRNLKINKAKLLASALLVGGSIGVATDLAKDTGSSAISSVASVLEPVEVWAVPCYGPCPGSIPTNTWTTTEATTEATTCYYKTVSNSPSFINSGPKGQVGQDLSTYSIYETTWVCEPVSQATTQKVTQATTQKVTEATTEATTQTTTVYVPPSTKVWVTVDGVVGGKLQFDTATGMIIGAESSITSIILPSTINGVAVLGISDGAFKDLIKLTSVTIPYGFSYIPANAFNGCISLVSINLPTTIVSIGANAFLGITTLQTINFAGSSWDWTNNVVVHNTGNTCITSSSSITTLIHAIEYSQSYYITEMYTNTLYNQMLEGISSGTVTLVSGKLPTGLGLYPNGLLYGIPTQSGTYTFIVKNGDNYYKYSITIKIPTALDLIYLNITGINIVTPINPITSNSGNYFLVIDKSWKYFNCLYINGVRFVSGVDYNISGDDDSTTITLSESAIARLPQGDNVITTIFDNTANDNIIDNTSVFYGSSGSYGNPETRSVSYSVNKTAEQDTSSSMPLKDVKTSDWYYNALEYLYKLGIMKGKTDEVFAPSDNLTRAELVLTLYRITGEPSATKNSFTDVKDSDWYADAVSWAKTTGIVNGTGDGSTFSPNNPVTKEDMATIINRYCSYKAIQIPLSDSTIVADINAVQDYAKGHVTTMYQGGILSVDEDNNFNPKLSTTRADAAYIIANFLLKY